MASQRKPVNWKQWHESVYTTFELSPIRSTSPLPNMERKRTFKNCVQLVLGGKEKGRRVRGERTYQVRKESHSEVQVYRSMNVVSKRHSEMKFLIKAPFRILKQ